MNTYAQHEEDLFIFNLIKRLDLPITPSFIDLGACDGIHMSNTRLFAEIGWSGVFVEPSKHYFKQLQENYSHRKNINTINAAIGPLNGKVEFYFNPKNPDLSSIIGFDGAEKYYVDVITFNKLFCNPKFNNTGILSIDVEGIDTLILKAALESDIDIQIIIIEGNTLDIRKYQIEILNKDYHLLNTLSVNTIWIKRNLYEKYNRSTEL